MVNLNLSIIEQAIKDEMAAQIESGHWSWIREIKTYSGEFDDDISVIIKAFPAIWITFDGSGSPKRISADKVEYPVKFAVLVGARSLRNEEAQRHGAGADIGTYQMLDYVQRLLLNNDLTSQQVKGLAPIMLGRTKTIFNTSTRGQSLSVLAQEFTTQYVIQASDRFREENAVDDHGQPLVAEIHRINFDYYLEPSDGEKDASDLVELKP